MTTNDLDALGALADTDAELADVRSAAEEILGRAWSVDRARDAFDGDEAAWASPLWPTVVELGWADVLVPVSAGGGGAGAAMLCTLAQAAAEVGANVPLVAAAVCADALGSTTEKLQIPLPAPATGDGTAMAVPFAAVADRFLVLEDDSIVSVDAGDPAVEITPVRPLDHGPAANVTIGAAADRTVVHTSATDRWDRLARLLTLGRLAELIGTAAAANRAAAAYACERVAFGRPIGTYQAIKHRLVDQRADIEVARALLRRAADAIDATDPEARALVSLAAFWGIDRLRRVPEGATQVFGGIAYTWEHPMHLHLRRAACLAPLLGPRATHRRIATEWLCRTRGGIDA